MSDKRYFPLNGLRLCIDEINGEDVKGTFYSPMDERQITFSGFEEFLLKADRLFNRHGYPQAFMEARSFRKVKPEDNRYSGMPRAVRGYEELVKHTGRQATFNVMIQSRRHATWQGVVRTGEGELIAPYDGVLELIEILRSSAM